MKAVRMRSLGGPESLFVDTVDAPAPAAGQVLIKVLAAGVGYGDVLRRRGDLGPVAPLPAGLGLQVSGTVAVTGPGVGDLSVGQRVAAVVEAGYAEYAIAATETVIPLPDSVGFIEASILPVQGITAYQTLTEAGRLSRGDTVLIHAAAGGVGGIAVQLARLLRAGTVIGLANGPGKRDFVRSLGADAAFDPADGDWPDRVLELTGGRGADVVLDSVGGTAGAAGLPTVAPFGRVVLFGAASGRPTRLDPMWMMGSNAAAIGYSFSGWARRPGRFAAAATALTRYLDAGKLRLIVGRTFPLEQAAEAHRQIAERGVFGGTALLTRPWPARDNGRRDPGQG